MMQWIAFAVLAALPGQAETLVVPSGQQVTFVDTIQNEPGAFGLTYRFRFVAPAIAREGGTMGFEEAERVMAWLCDNFALPRLANLGPVPSQIIISLSDRMVDFGSPTPEATQFFEAYTVEDGVCIWEIF